MWCQRLFVHRISKRTKLIRDQHTTCRLQKPRCSMWWIRWLISAKQTLPFLTGFESVQNYFYAYNTLLYAYKTPLYAYKTFCTLTKPFVRVQNPFVRVQNLLYAYKTFCTHTKPVACAQNLLYAYKVFCYLLIIYDHVILLCARVFTCIHAILYWESRRNNIMDMEEYIPARKRYCVTQLRITYVGIVYVHYKWYDSRNKKGCLGFNVIAVIGLLLTDVRQYVWWLHIILNVIRRVSWACSHDSHSCLGANPTENKAIRDGKYFAPPHASAWQVHLIQIEKFDIFSWRHFTARSSFYIINCYGYPRGSHEKYLKEIFIPSFWDMPLNCYMLNVAHVTNDVKWRPIVTTFGTLIENMSRTGLYDCHIF